MQTTIINRAINQLRMPFSFCWASRPMTAKVRRYRPRWCPHYGLQKRIGRRQKTSVNLRIDSVRTDIIYCILQRPKNSHLSSFLMFQARKKAQAAGFKWKARSMKHLEGTNIRLSIDEARFRRMRCGPTESKAASGLFLTCENRDKLANSWKQT